MNLSTLIYKRRVTIGYTLEEFTLPEATAYTVMMEIQRGSLEQKGSFVI